MSIVTITLGNKNFELACQEANKNSIIALSELLSSEFATVKGNNPSASFELLLVITALGLINDKQSKFKESGGEILENANKEFQETLLSLYSELKIVAEKLE